MTTFPAYAKTFKFLKKTDNQAAVELMTVALQSSFEEAGNASLRSLMEHRSMAAKKIVLKRIPAFSEKQRRIIEKNPSRLARVIESVVKYREADLLPTAVAAVREFRLYDAVPALAGLLGETEPALQRAMLDTIYHLAECFYEDLRQAKRSVDLDAERRKMTSALEVAAGRLRHHGDRRMVDALLMVTSPSNATLKRLLQSPREMLHQPVVESLRTSEHGGVIRLLLAYLEDPYMPIAARNAICERSDVKFVDNMLRLVNLKSNRVLEVLRSVDRLTWAAPDDPTLHQLGGECQQRAIELLMATAVPRETVLAVLLSLLKDGKEIARQYAAERIAEFEHPDATEVVLDMLDDPDPIVRANLLKQLRPRQIPGALSRLIQMADTDAVPVRRALRDALPEFGFRQFFGNFEALSDDRVKLAGCLVARIDLDAPELTLAEMTSLSPVRRRKAIKAAMVMGIVPQLEERVIELLNDEDHTVRIEAAKALSQCETLPTWDALRDALLDRSVLVRQAAEGSLQTICSVLASKADAESAEDEENGGAAAQSEEESLV